MCLDDLMLSKDCTPFCFLTTMRYVDFTPIGVFSAQGIGYPVSPCFKDVVFGYLMMELVINVVSY